MQKQDDSKIAHEFRTRQSRQFLAIAVTLLLLVVLTLLYKHTALFAHLSRMTISFAQFMIIVVFIVFTVFNWRCPSCRKYLGNNIGRQNCRRCGTKLQ